MRYLHQQAEPIGMYVRTRGLVVRKYDNVNPSSSATHDMSLIEETLTTSETLWGDALPYYLRISKAEDGWPLTLRRAVSEIEASSSADDFILVAYQDGGLISVSGVMLPFQVGARSAEWWSFGRRSRPQEEC
jgi:hypothetical protein